MRYQYPFRTYQILDALNTSMPNNSAQSRCTVTTTQLFFLFHFKVPFKIISLMSRQAHRKVLRNGSTPGKPPDTPESRTWLFSHVASVGLEPTPDTAEIIE